MFKKFQLRYYNYILFILITTLSILGIVFVNSADPSYTFKMCLGVASGLILMAVVSLMDYKWIFKFYWLIYVVMIILLLIVKFWGSSGGGATRWIKITDFLTLQPSEFSKIILVLFAAKFISVYKHKLNSWKFLGILAVILIIPLVLIVTQPALSSTVLICLVLLSVIYCAGLRYKIIGICLAIVVPIGLGAFIYIQNPAQTLIEHYQWKRIMAYIDPENYDDNVYQQRYSVQAIGSGLLDGKGLNNNDASSVKNAGYIAVAESDFIFAVIGEELGFAGCVVVLLMLALIIMQCMFVAVKAKNFEGRLFCCGMAALIAFQTFINIGVATQILPNTGQPLPFVSYGLSSLWALYIGMGILLNIYLQRNSHNYNSDPMLIVR